MQHLWPELTEALCNHLPLAPSVDEGHYLVQALVYVGQLMAPDEVVGALAKYEVDDHELSGLELWFFSKRFAVHLEWPSVESGRPVVEVVPWSELKGVAPSVTYPLSRESRLSSLTLRLGERVVETKEWDLGYGQSEHTDRVLPRNRALLDLALSVLADRR